ncbi:MAG TPA: glycosyltransferase family 4 protein, partial [Patescibacteria group bacterium]|nr:glycosyltransferase family 4 protein [Patescibacteria group bacterium]
LSLAAKRTLEELLDADYKSIASKVSVIYPALKIETNLNTDHSYIKADSSALNLLFVGNQAYLKGLEELLIAITRLKNNNLKLFIISNDAESLLKKYPLNSVQLFQPNFNKEQITTKFFRPADAFIMPTKEDTFGMAILDSLSCGTPVITTKQFALPELVTNGSDGLLLEIKRPLLDTVLIPSKKDMSDINHSNIDELLVDQIAYLLEAILSHKIRIEDFRNKGIAKFKNSHMFSTNTRNQALYRVYKNALAQ